MRANISNKMRHFLNLDPDSVTLYYKEHQKSIKVRLGNFNRVGWIDNEERGGLQVHVS